MVNTNNQDQEIIIKRISKLAEKIFKQIKATIPPEWLTSDITVAQLRVLLVLYTEGPSRMSSIASSLEIAISTATGIVDKLVNKNLVMRHDDPEDRRLVICTLSTQGQKLMNRLWMLGQNEIERLVRGLSMEQLKKAEEVAGFLFENAKSKSM